MRFFFVVNLCLILSLNNVMYGQGIEDSTVVQLPSLEFVISNAIENSALVKDKLTQTDIKHEELDLERGSWAKYLFVEGAANYGKYDRIVMQENRTDVVLNSGSLSSSEQTTYYSGVSLKLPLSAITGRSKEVSKKKLEIQKSIYEKDEAIQQLKYFIIDLYYETQFLNESMHNHFEIYQTLEISYEKAKKDLFSGKTDINDFAILSSTVGKARNDYLKAKNNFLAQYLKLEKATGVSLSNKHK
ncbi:TolC family protein [Plebeiibacterium sediminum]|uniref:TolC family protein n=1 Tax=Plebeiibacterium sediminum TaxID=2992112 RepID=A0AAE3M6G8_9BACT|nr:TolC family protein [Plebeiobacterium sediminum]MCW3787465.1 TolC family protein [Plebeiobacterium sediminum]